MLAAGAATLLLLATHVATAVAAKYATEWVAVVVIVGCVILCVGVSFLFLHNIDDSLKQFSFAPHHPARTTRIRSILPSFSTAHESFSKLAEELKDCQTYIPDDEISDKVLNPLTVRMQPPTGVVSLAFTDIEESSELWQTFPNQMYLALQMHHAAVRRCYSEYNAYEVKTIGDAFMLAFDLADDACGFCLASQEQLLEQDWPSDLFEHRACRKISDSSGTPVFGGLRVRMGVHTGEVTKVQDPVTGRADYYGSTVNKAARVESSVVGGVIAVTDEVLHSLSKELEFTSVDLGEVNLKGVGVTRITSILSQSLHSRQPYIKLTPTLTTKTPDVPAIVLPEHKIVVEEVAKRRFTRGRLDKGNTRQKKLSLSDAVVGVTRIGHARRAGVALFYERYCYILSCVERSVERTGGVSMGCAGDSLTSLWKSSNHRLQGARYCGLVWDDLESESVHIGLANGPILTGTVDAGSKKYRSAIGSCVELAAALAEEAEHLEAHALIPSPYVAAAPVIAGFVRPVGLWNVIGHNVQIEVMELRAESLNETNKWSWMLGSELAYDDWSGDEYREAFDTAFSNEPDLGPLKALSQAWASDVVLKNLLRDLMHEPQRISFTPGECVEDASRGTLHANYARSCSTRSSRQEGGFYTMHEVEENGYIVINSIVHDVTSYITAHPGGAAAMRQYVGRDVTEAFLNGHGSGHVHSGNARAILATMRIGRLEEAKPPMYSEQGKKGLLMEQWEIVTEMGTQDLGNRVLSAFISYQPEVAAMWGLEDGDVFNPLLHGVAKKFMDLMGMAVEDYSKAKPIIQRVGGVHKEKNVTRQHYAKFWEALDSTLQDYLGARYTSESRFVWEEFYTKMVKDMDDKPPSRALLKARNLLRFSRAARLSPFVQMQGVPASHGSE